MTEQYILSIDGGMSTGIALLSYADETAPDLVKSWQFPGGLGAFIKWAKDNWEVSQIHWDAHEETVESLIDPRNHFKMIPAADLLKIVYDDVTREELGLAVDVPKRLTVIAEKFTPRPSTATGFQQSIKTVEPLRLEGAMIALEMMPDYSPDEPRWVAPPLQYLVGGKSLPEKKKRQAKFLKDIGMYVTGKTFGTPDADDARSAIAHGLNYLAREIKHKPTYELISDWVDRND